MPELAANILAGALRMSNARSFKASAVRQAALVATAEHLHEAHADPQLIATFIDYCVQHYDTSVLLKVLTFPGFLHVLTLHRVQAILIRLARALAVQDEVPDHARQDTLNMLLMFKDQLLESDEPLSAEAWEALLLACIAQEQWEPALAVAASAVAADATLARWQPLQELFARIVTDDLACELPEAGFVHGQALCQALATALFPAEDAALCLRVVRARADVQHSQA